MKKYHAKYYLKNKKKILKQAKNWYKNNLEKATLNNKTWRTCNKRDNRDYWKLYKILHADSIKARKDLRRWGFINVDNNLVQLVILYNKTKKIMKGGKNAKIFYEINKRYSRNFSLCSK